MFFVPNSAGWSSLVARRAHNPKVVGSNPAPATKLKAIDNMSVALFFRVMRPTGVARWGSDASAAGGR